MLIFFFFLFLGTNVAFRKPANQSTTVRGGSAGNANDGDKATVHDGKQCTETMKETSPWWQVGFGIFKIFIRKDFS